MSADDELDFRLLFESLGDALLVIRPDAPRFTVLAATGAASAPASSRPEVVVGRGLFELLPADSGELRASLERVLATRLPDAMAPQKDEGAPADGAPHVRHRAPRNIPVLAPGGEIRYIVHRVDDVTALVGATETTARRVDDLERQIAELRRDLDATIRELEGFSYSVSHDLRAPLRAIDGFSRALVEDCGEQIDARGRGYLERVGNAAQRMNRQIDALLDLSRLGRATFTKERVDVSALVAGVVADLRRAHPQRSVTVDVAPGLEATGDRRLLTALFTHLVGNAWKFTSRTADSRIEVGRTTGDEPALFVRDNGAGFDPAYATRMFAPFQRFHPITDFEGVGIGLAVAQRAALRHGGRIWAESAPGKGATFYVVIPESAA